MKTRLPGRIRIFLPSLLIGCAAPSDSHTDTAASGVLIAPNPAPAPSPARVDLVDTTIAQAVAGVAGWNYQQSATADFDGDGQSEKVVLTARVEMIRGRPAWDDGQPWQAYVEELDGTRTYVFARYVQLGTLSLRITEPEEREQAVIVLLEHLPDRLSVFEVEYDGPAKVRMTAPYERALNPRGDIASPVLP